jgi:hypothetical protein
VVPNPGSLLKLKYLQDILSAIKILYSLTSVSFRIVHEVSDSIVGMVGVGIVEDKSSGSSEP